MITTAAMIRMRIPFFFSVPSSLVKPRHSTPYGLIVTLVPILSLRPLRLSALVPNLSLRPLRLSAVLYMTHS
jgi:hypothetical protein